MLCSHRHTSGVVIAGRFARRKPDGQMSQNDLQTIEGAMAAYPDLISLVEKGAGCSDSYYDTEYGTTLAEFQSNFLEELQSGRSVARYLCDRSLVLAAKGDREAAVRASILNFQLARHLDREPSLVANLVAIAVRGIGITAANRVLRSGPIADSARNALDAELARHDLTDSFRQALITERAVEITAFHDINLGRYWPARAYWNNALIYNLDVMDSQLALASQPYYQVLQAGPTDVSKPVSPWTTLTDLTLPAIHAARDATERTRAMMGCLRILNAITRLEQQGAEVTGFVDLHLPEEETIDPFTGQPLLMKKLPEGWIIYSVGPDLKDDGGKVEDLSDVGLGPVPPLPSLE